MLKGQLARYFHFQPSEMAKMCYNELSIWYNVMCNQLETEAKHGVSI